MTEHLVTGGAGMIGSHLARRLLERGDKVTVVDNLLSGSRMNIQDLVGQARFKFVEDDLCRPNVALEHCKGKDYVWALGANMGGIMAISSVHAAIVYDNGLINLNTLNAAWQQHVPHYFFSSSACIYPVFLQEKADIVPLKESDAYPAMPDQSYGWEKLFTEQACLAYAKDHGMDIHIGRFHNVMGTAYTAFDKFKGKAPCHLIIKAIRHPNPPFVVWGDGQQTRSFLYIDDCIDAMLLLMQSNYNQPVNIGTDELVTIDELAKLAIKISGKDIPILHDLSAYQGVRGRNADLTLVKQVLGWSPKVKLEDGMREVYEWAEKHYDQLEGL